jgi:SAM-dependent methyltransferase
MELLLIRWLAFVKNLALIASFLGLGIGYAKSAREEGFDLRRFALLFAALIFGVGAVLGSPIADRVNAGPASPESNLGLRAVSSPIELWSFFLIIAVVFALTILSLIPVGQLTADALRGIPSIRAYTANIAGSLIGVLCAFALASASTPIWLSGGIFLALLAYYSRGERSLRAVGLVAALLAVVSMFAVDRQPGRKTIWSPYNKIEIQQLPVQDPVNGEEVPYGWLLKVQNLFYQQVIDLSPATVQRYSHLRNVRAAAFAYNFPYRFKHPHRVLVLGAGTGNDVAAALRAGASEVVAVEIDPRISGLGRELHPERPYADPRVKIVNDDARAYLKRNGQPFDMIVFGLLDAHTSFFSSLAGGIRLDNYVYTVEAFQQALHRLTPDGLLALSFYVEQPWIATRMGEMMTRAAGEPPLVSRIAANTFTFVAGPASRTVSSPLLSHGVPTQFASHFPGGPSSKDDWPFMYLRSRMIPPTIWVAAIGILAVTAAIVMFAFGRSVKFERHFFFLGAGFLLLETRTIAQMALIYGTTWRVSAIAISTILAVILVANAIVLRHGPFNLAPLYAILFVSLVVSYFIRPSMAVGSFGAVLGVTAVIAAPLLVAAFIFASSTAERADLRPILGSNLIGSVLGGLLENSSLILGISALNLIAIVVYALSFRRSARA